MQLSYSGTTLVGVQDSAGRSVSYGYTGSAVTSVTDVRGQVWHYGYSQNYLVSITDPLGHTLVTTAYDLNSGRVSSQTDALGKTTSYAWGAGAALGTATVAGQQIHHYRAAPSRVASLAT